ncbi:Hypothetical protein WP1231 [Wolbachia endosymbiont of Culex quinquefasciatus Pel]|uniref:hypothetical protein n=1 Tax=unclassified Wolbachia TaxID=2640676 RepID=UPI0001762079|nr:MULTISPECIES: hypothetical protein [unclassified Wolbachia]CAQ55339.1 Hypothetical protein WP1231 [Wolbachia endosymbiont of Culex quinquefasciatus Pel]
MQKSLLKRELLIDTSQRSVQQTRTSIFEYVEIRFLALLEFKEFQRVTLESRFSC